MAADGSLIVSGKTNGSMYGQSGSGASDAFVTKFTQTSGALTRKYTQLLSGMGNGDVRISIGSSGKMVITGNVGVSGVVKRLAENEVTPPPTPSPDPGTTTVVTIRELVSFSSLDFSSQSEADSSVAELESLVRSVDDKLSGFHYATDRAQRAYSFFTTMEKMYTSQLSAMERLSGRF